MIDLIIWCLVPAMAHMILLSFAAVFALVIVYFSKQLVEQHTGPSGQTGDIDILGQNTK